MALALATSGNLLAEEITHNKTIDVTHYSTPIDIGGIKIHTTNSIIDTWTFDGKVYYREDQAELAKFDSENPFIDIDLSIVGIKSDITLEKHIPYSQLNVTGLSDVHGQGWFGDGINIEIVDLNESHGKQVTDIISAVAPGSTLQFYNLIEKAYVTEEVFSSADVTNHSYVSPINDNPYFGVINSAYIQMIRENNYNPNALHVYATANDTHCGPVSQLECDGQMQGYIRDVRSNSYFAGDVLFVGAYDSNGYNSYEIGEGEGHEIIEDSYLVAKGTTLNGKFSGTSFAAPRVTGAAALLMHKFTNIDARDTKDILLLTADDTFSGYSLNNHGQGLLDLSAAMSPIGVLK